VLDNKYNLVPRKQFCGAKVGSDYPAMRATYDDAYMKEYEASDAFLSTSDGKKTRLPNHNSTYGASIDYNYDSCVMFIDTDAEAEIKLGTSYPFPAMNEGECMINNQMASLLNVQVGDIIYN